jgi:signal transduction histidine kinase
MRVSTRLYLAVVPAILGVMVVAALAYWGERGRQAPATVVLIAVVASIASLITAWRNTRYVARRVESLAQGSDGRAGMTTGTLPRINRIDELDEIEATVTDLNAELVNQRLAAKLGAQRAEERAAEYAELLEGVIATMGANLEQARLPLHILLSSPFGELNENQEEMLDAAQQAVEAMDVHVTQLRRLLELDRSKAAPSPQRVRLDELLRAPVTIAKARASQSAVRVVVDVPETVLPAIVDPMRAQEALTVLIGDAVAHAPEGGDVHIRAQEASDDRVVLTITPRRPTTTPQPLAVRLAQRILEHGGGTLTNIDNSTRIELPAERALITLVD